MYYFYEGRTIRGLGLVGWALLIAMVATIVLGVTSAVVGLLYGVLLQNPAPLLGPLVTIVAAECGALVAEVAAAILFLVGFYQIYAGRHEYGLEQAHAVERALIFLIVYIVMSAVSAVYTSANGLFMGIFGSPVTTTLIATVVLSPINAFFAGLTLVHSARAVASPAARPRMRTALILGVVGAGVGPGLSLLAMSSSVVTIERVSAGLVAAALGGQGIAAISVFLFWLAYQDTKKGLEAGKPSPVLPRIDQAYPWLYRPWAPYPYPYPTPPVNPPPPTPPKP